MSYGNNMDTGTLWWESIAGPSNMIMGIQYALAEGHSVVCNVTTALSHRWVFCDSIGHWLTERSVEVRHIDCSEAYCGGDITEFLLQQIQPDLLTEYRRRSSPQFMRDKGLLHGKLLWIRGVAPRYLRDWIQYISSYRSHDLEHGLMLMEVQSVPSVRLPNNLRFFDYSKHIGKNDLRLYASILSESYLDGEPGSVKQYAVELATALCVTDGELVNDLLLHPDFIHEDPIEVLKQVVRDNYADSPRGKEEGHPFQLLEQQKMREWKDRVWSAQIRVGYPRIEMERQALIQQWEAEIREALSLQYHNERNDCAEYFTDYEKNRITNPYDVEVGMLQRMMTLRRYENRDQYMFYLPNPDDRDWVYLLRDCRNDLAHLDCCDKDQFYKLLTAE